MVKFNCPDSIQPYYTETNWINRNALIQNEILPYKTAVFDILKIRFNYEAESDPKSEKYESRKRCAKNSRKIHFILNWLEPDENEENLHEEEEISNKDEIIFSQEEKDRIFDTIQDIMDMNYQDKKAFFDTLKEVFAKDKEVKDILNEICNDLSELKKSVII